MTTEESTQKMNWMAKAVAIDLMLSMSFSLFGMLLIFGLGFVFPTIDPYIVIKWIIIVAGAMFAFSFLKYLVYFVMKMKTMKMTKDTWSSESGLKKALKTVKGKKSSKR